MTDVVHRIRWYVWAWNADGSHERFRHAATMRGTWGWDVECSCGWETRTGGATKGYIRNQVWNHKFEHNLHPWQNEETR
jgi:hypothetical protein